ncbi:hypothetical protein [Leminorella grimontii]|uniref:hypothetical protein n=1 Tax=Leminorella grimontii TaxID=82981 RepID=UPI002081E62A|nr:hypothetical protein [Leminorella grimontii]GKX59837.1 hypothetical protein SOASR031_21520 [Leminorella grimontii]
MFTDRDEIEESLCDADINEKDARILAQQARSAIQIYKAQVCQQHNAVKGMYA